MKTKSIMGGIVSGILFLCICTVSVLGSDSSDKKVDEIRSYDEEMDMKQLGQLARKKRSRLHIFLEWMKIMYMLAGIILK